MYKSKFLEDGLEVQILVGWFTSQNSGRMGYDSKLWEDGLQVQIVGWRDYKSKFWQGEFQVPILVGVTTYVASLKCVGLRVHILVGVSVPVTL